MSLTKGYCVKYCLTQGIFPVEGVVKDNDRIILQTGYYQSFSSKEWDRTLEGAKAKAEVMRQKRIKSLKASLKKVESMTIEVVE